MLRLMFYSHILLLPALIFLAPYLAHAQSTRTTESYSVREYRIHKELIDMPWSIPEEDGLKIVGQRFGVSASEVKSISQKVLRIQSQNGWFGKPDAEIRHASDWAGERN